MAVEDTVGQQTAMELALDAYTKGELIRMLSNVLKAYVIDGVTPLKPDVGRVHVPTHLRELDFSSLIETLKFHLDLPDLERFNVIDGQVYVMLGDREYALHGPAPTGRPTPQNQPQPVAQQSIPEPSPTPATTASAESRPRRGGGVFGGGSSGPAENIPMAPKPKEPQKQDTPTEADDRFRMLELD